MGNLNVQNFCDCVHTDPNLETSFKSNQYNDKVFCPFFHNSSYQNTFENNKKNKEAPKKKSKFDFRDIEMNFEYHTTNVGKDQNKLNTPTKTTFNLNPNINYDNIRLLNDINGNDININLNINNDEENNNENRIISIESDNYNGANNNFNMLKNHKENEEEKINTNKNLKTKEISSNSDYSNIKTNIEKPKLTPKNGLNFQIWSKNAYYIGNYKDDMADGIGKLITGNSKHYGEFKFDQANGYGIFHNEVNGTEYEGYWLNDIQNDYGIEKWNNESIYFGKYLQGEKNGIGTYIWKDGNRYEGEFKNNKFNGYGIYFYNKNKIYLGEWENNQKNGYGEFVSGDKLYIGYFLNDQKDGFGVSYWKNEDKIFIGFWKNNKKHGFGKYFHENKIKFGIWDKDNENQKIKCFNSDDEAFDYLKNNNNEIYLNFFKKNKEEIIVFLNQVYEDDFIVPCSTSEAFSL